MSERVYVADNSEAKDKKSEKKDKDAKDRAAKFAASLVTHGEDMGKPKLEAVPPRTGMFANLFIEKEESNAGEKKPAEGGEGKGKSKAEKRRKKPEPIEQLVAEKAPNVLSRGEVVVDLRGDTPVVDHEIPLHSIPEQSSAEHDKDKAGAEEQPQVSAYYESPMLHIPSQPGPQHEGWFRDVPGNAGEAAEAPGSSGNVPPIQPPEVPPTGGGGERPGEPDPESEPEPVSARLPSDAESQWRPAEAYRRYMRRQELDRREVDELVENAREAGVRKGVLTGLFTGAMYEHIQHRRREKKTERKAKEERRRLEEARLDYKSGQREQERRQAKDEVRFAAAEQRYQGAEKRAEERDRHTVEREQKLEERVRLAEQAADAAKREQLKVAAEHEIQMSAWHAVEIDPKTGKAVEKPSFAYGREYYRERAQEGMPPDQRNAIAGGAAIIGAAGARSDDGQGAAGSGPMGATQNSQPADIPDATTRRPAGVAGQSARDDSSTTSTAPLWPWVLVLLAVVISLIVALG